MGMRLDGFEIELEFGPDGDVKQVSYHDAEGCGLKKLVDPSLAVESIVRLHLNHYLAKHGLTPRIQCDRTINTGMGYALRCVKESTAQTKNTSSNFKEQGQ